jgi:Ser/Thr protein kinase RdoA (MazF antagonist)
VSLFVHEKLRFAAFPWLPGRAPELDDLATLTLLGRTLARMHALGARRRFEHRPALTVERLGDQARERVLDSGFVPEALEEQYARVSEQVIGRVRHAFDAFGPMPRIRIHGDCHAGNILWRESGPLFVDLDDCMSGPRVQDLWMFLAGGAAAQQTSWTALMEGYEVFGEFDSAELTLVEALRSLRILHHAAWIAHRWGDPAFPRAFPWFGEGRFWERHISDLFEQLAAMDEPPILAR